MKISRREFLNWLKTLGIVSLLWPGFPFLGSTSTDEESHYIEETFQQALDRLFGQRPVQEGKISISAPKIAENGASVPIEVEVDFPMNEDAYIKTLYVFSEKNPVPLIGKFHFTPDIGKAYLELRIKMAETGPVHVYAETSQGTLYHGQRSVRVALGGCG